MYKKLIMYGLLLGIGTATLSAQDNAKRTADLELHILHPQEGQEIVGLKTIIQLEAENHGPDDLYKGDSLVINFPGSNTYARFLESDLKKGERVKIFDELITSPQYSTFTLTAYLVEDLTKVGYQGKPFAQSWIDPDSTNNIKSVRFSNVANSTAINESAISATRIYPNPVGNALYLHCNESQQGYFLLRVYNLAGTAVLEYNITVADKDISVPVYMLPKGLYVLQLLDVVNTNVYTSQFFKQ